MQLRRLILGILTGVLIIVATGAATAQSLSPMRKTGATPSDVKGFRLTVGNPYPSRMTFVVIPMDTKFQRTVPQAVVVPSEFRLAPGASRPVTVQFKIGPDAKERTIGVCVLPKDLEGPLLPRVCGTYTGTMLAGGGS